MLLLADTTYPAVRSAAARIAARCGAALLEVQLLDALGQEEEIVRRYEAALKAGRWEGPCRCHATSPQLWVAMPCHAMPCHAMPDSMPCHHCCPSWHVISRHLMPHNLLAS